MSNMAKIEEMECLLREAQAEKLRLLEHRVPFTAECFSLFSFVSQCLSHCFGEEHSADTGT